MRNHRKIANILLLSLLLVSSCKGENKPVEPTPTPEQEKKEDIAVESIQVFSNGDIKSLAIGNTLQLYYLLSPTGATGEVIWSSSDSQHATIDETGLVTALSVGSSIEVTFKASLKGNESIYGEYTLTISPFVAQIEIDTDNGVSSDPTYKIYESTKKCVVKFDVYEGYLLKSATVTCDGKEVASSYTVKEKSYILSFLVENGTYSVSIKTKKEGLVSDEEYQKIMNVGKLGSSLTYTLKNKSASSSASQEVTVRQKISSDSARLQFHNNGETEFHNLIGYVKTSDGSVAVPKVNKDGTITLNPLTHKSSTTGEDENDVWSEKSYSINPFSYLYDQDEEAGLNLLKQRFKLDNTKTDGKSHLIYASTTNTVSTDPLSKAVKALGSILRNITLDKSGNTSPMFDLYTVTSVPSLEVIFDEDTHEMESFTIIGKASSYRSDAFDYEISLSLDDNGLADLKKDSLSDLSSTYANYIGSGKILSKLSQGNFTLGIQSKDWGNNLSNSANNGGSTLYSGTIYSDMVTEKAMVTSLPFSENVYSDSTSTSSSSVNVTNLVLVENSTDKTKADIYAKKADEDELESVSKKSLTLSSFYPSMDGLSSKLFDGKSNSFTLNSESDWSYLSALSVKDSVVSPLDLLYGRHDDATSSNFSLSYIDTFTYPSIEDFSLDMSQVVTATDGSQTGTVKVTFTFTKLEQVFFNIIGIKARTSTVTYTFSDIGSTTIPNDLKSLVTSAKA